MPSLGTDQSFINGRYSLSVSNWGVGAAFVHWMRVFRNGELQEDLSRLLLEDRVGEAKVHEGFIYLVKQFSVAPNDKVTIFDVPFERERVEKLIRELRIEFCYCSIYDECWVGEVGHGPGKMILTQQHNSCD